MPLEIKQFLQAHPLRAAGLPPVTELQVRQIGGGSINAAYQLSTKDNDSEMELFQKYSISSPSANDGPSAGGLRRPSRWFAKFNIAGTFPDLFLGEANGLSLLRRQHILRVPKTIAHIEADDHQLLILEWIDEGLRSSKFWQLFGEQLAALHRITQPQFGLSADNLVGTHPAADKEPALSANNEPALPANNYMGALPQDNTPSADWVGFFIHRRLEPQLRLAADAHLLDKEALMQFQRLYNHLPAIFPSETPSLLHGDLWSGNFLCDEQSRPVLIDPAVYYGHRYMDLAMTTLFGGFETPFYEAYHHHYPLAPDYRRAWDICNLYPLLIHLNLFGHSYLPQILNTIRSY